MNSCAIVLSQDQRQYFRDELRQARAAALLNAEGFEPIVVALERIGSLLNPLVEGFGNYGECCSTLPVTASTASLMAGRKRGQVHLPEEGGLPQNRKGSG